MFVLRALGIVNWTQLFNKINGLFFTGKITIGRLKVELPV